MRLSDYVKRIAGKFRKKEETKEIKNVSGAFYDPLLAMKIARNNRNKFFKHKRGFANG